ncbi:RNA polymerase sigma factor [Rhabdothermincola sp.]|uniref:RNA polymerase sigma factor n=1 Tax=Rhabdothermincola sp. TaxID=2820405 RepID=UPI002FE0D4EE
MIGDSFPEVLAAAQRGEPSAIEAIYRDVAPLVLGYLRANGARDPEDTSSEVFVSMMRRLPHFTGDEQRFRSWLLTIAYRRMVDDFRRRGRRREDPVPTDEMGERVILLTDGESEALARLRSQGVLEALDQLTDDQRAALVLRVLADLSVREVAEVMGKPETAVKALLRRGFASLARHLAAGGEDVGEAVE